MFCGQKCRNVTAYAVFYTDQATRRQISNAATPKPERFDEEWAKLDLAPMRMRGRAEFIRVLLDLDESENGVNGGRNATDENLASTLRL